MGQTLMKNMQLFWLVQEKKGSIIHQVAASISDSAFYQITLVVVIILIFGTVVKISEVKNDIKTKLAGAELL